MIVCRVSDDAPQREHEYLGLLGQGRRAAPGRGDAAALGSPVLAAGIAGS